MRPRQSGVLLPISSLPSAHGVGDLGPSARAFARLLAGAGQSLWQFLPLGPVSPALGNSPYSSPSAFAGNPLFISPDLMREAGLISYADVDAAHGMAVQECEQQGLFFLRDTQNDQGCPVPYDQVARSRKHLLHTAFERNRQTLAADGRFTAFCRAHAHWLDDYARFVTIKEVQDGRAWYVWPEPLKRRDPAALADWDRNEAASLERERFIQYLFSRQWTMLRRLCNDLGIRLIGDAPLYVTHDSADVWANPQYFNLDEDCAPRTVAGVPPDYFSATGQRWGNPVYRWDALARDGFAWWCRRLEHNLLLADYVRLDHFRGFAGYWEIPAEEDTAVNGAWVEAPGMELFTLMARRNTALPFIAEDLGVITADVRELRAAFDLPGMHVLQFAFGGRLADNPDVPFRHGLNSVVYTGTHDNAPTRAWFAVAGADERENLRAYVGHGVEEAGAADALLRLALGSASRLAVTPVQDILGLGAEARMNTPSLPSGNWTWRMNPEQLRPESFAGLRRLTELYGRSR
jgi:4-alpha-glucanotransferase